MDTNVKKRLSALGFLSLNGESLQRDGTQVSVPPIVREPHESEYVSQTRYTFRPWFWWIIYCPHNKLWQQQCAACRMTKRERAERLNQCNAKLRDALAKQQAAVLYKP